MFNWYFVSCHVLNKDRQGEQMCERDRDKIKIRESAPSSECRKGNTKKRTENNEKG